MQASLSLPGSPFNLRRGSRGSQFSVTWARTNGRRLGDRKPLVLQTYLDAQEHLPYADDSTAVTPMSEENGAIIIPVYTNLNSRHSSYTSHSSRISYTSHGDIYGRGGALWTKESQLRSRRNLHQYYNEVSTICGPHLSSKSNFILKSHECIAWNKHNISHYFSNYFHWFDFQSIWLKIIFEFQVNRSINSFLLNHLSSFSRIC